jgi:hypothetical protein
MEQKNFIDFILAAQEKKELLMEFLKKTRFEELKEFFNENGYLGIDDTDIKKIMKARETYKNTLGFQVGEDYY